MRFTEKEAVENYIIKQLSKNGWQYIPSSDLERDSFEEPLLIKNLIRKIRQINEEELTEEDINNVINALKFKSSTQEGIKEILNYLKQGVSIKLEKEKILYKVKLFDYQNPKNNEFIVTNQILFISGEKRKILDILLYVNGIPLVNIECKNPASFSESWLNAFKDIKHYEKSLPELYKYIQMGIAICEVAKYFPVVPWEDDETKIRISEWRVESKDSIDAIIQMLLPHTLLDLIKNFIFYRIEHGNATKVIARYIQYRAVNKIVQRVLDNLEGKEKKTKGLIWHWQGSGKTLEMIFSAYKLFYHSRLDNPTIFFVVDRKELEEQLFEEFNALDIPKSEIIGSIEDLKRMIEHDGYRGRRGLFITLVHKFRPEELKDLDKKISELSNTQETIKTRKNVIAFIDEGHRTQSGGLASQMKSILGENTTFFFAFTGTPISKPEKGIDTYRDFSYLPEEKYLDKYFITDSWQDGFTVRIAYQPALSDKEGIRLKKEMLEEFLKQKYQEIPDDIRDVVEEKIKEKLNPIKVYLENPERIKMVSVHIAEHFKKNLDGRFKALLTAVSREACILYKRELDKLLPSEYCEVVISFSDKKDSEIIKEYEEELLKKFKGKSLDEIKKEIVSNFREEEFPKILIVKDMLLTGFDAPILQTFYLDQPLKEHRLLQAIARTNRPYKDIKEVGLIVDYIGILKEFHRAFEIYSKEEIKGVLYSMEDLKREFLQKLKELMDIFESVPKDKTDRKTLLKAVEILTSDEKLAKKFQQEYKRLRKLFELLGTDVIKANKISEYNWLSQIFTFYIKNVSTEGEDEKLYVNKYFKKTIEIIHQTTQLREPSFVYPAVKFNEEYIKALEKKLESKEEKAANLVFTLNRYVLVNKDKGTIYESIVERVERLLEMWKQRTRDFEKIYQEGLEIWKEITSINKRKQRLKLSDVQYNFLLILEKELGKKYGLVEDARALFNKLDGILGIKDKKIPNWSLQTTIKKDVEKMVRRFVRKYIKEYGIRLDKVEKIYQRLMGYIIKNV